MGIHICRHKRCTLSTGIRYTGRSLHLRIWLRCNTTVLNAARHLVVRRLLDYCDAEDWNKKICFILIIPMLSGITRCTNTKSSTLYSDGQAVGIIHYLRTLSTGRTLRLRICLRCSTRPYEMLCDVSQTSGSGAIWPDASHGPAHSM
ncbi:uncharacterized protein [Atheta coriaria]|uniref:uncharacterized protein isoform X1 n=1 Tax=Dalotia coriaria TaxID=877792 RepID=UPI0031F446B5